MRTPHTERRSSSERSDNMWTTDGSGHLVYIGNGFANTYPTFSRLYWMTAWRPYYPPLH